MLGKLATDREMMIKVLIGKIARNFDFKGILQVLGKIRSLKNYKVDIS